MDDEYDIFKPIGFSDVINDEQILDFALSHICEKDSCDVHPIADQIVVTYIINSWAKEGKKQFNETEMQEAYNELVTDYIVTRLARTGLVDVRFDGETGEPLYSVTEKGKDKINDGY